VPRPSYIAPPVLASLTVYPSAAGPPDKVEFTVTLAVDPTVSFDSARATLATPLAEYELTVEGVEQLLPGVYRLVLAAAASTVERIAGDLGFTIPYRVVDAAYTWTLQWLGPLTLLRLSSLAPEEARGRPLAGLAVVSGGFGGAGVWSLYYEGAVRAFLGYQVYRHDFETVLLPLVSDPLGAGELVWVLESGVAEAEPAYAGFQVQVYAVPLGGRGLPRARLTLELYRGGELAGFFEENLFTAIVWWEVPRLLGERLYEPSASAAPPASKAVLC